MNAKPGFWKPFWPTDKLLLAYLAGASVLIAAYWSRLADAPALLAYHAAVLRGCNVDKPRNLAKSVTVE